MQSNSRVMTGGNILKMLLPYAIPLVLSNLLQTFYGIVDMIVVGQYVGAAGLSAVNNSSQITGLITGISMGVGTGGSVIVGQYFGARNVSGQRNAAGTMLSFSVLAGVAVSVLLFIFSTPLLTALGAPSLYEADVYLKICAVGMLPLFGYNALSGMMRAVGNSKWPLIFILIATLLNVVLDLLMIGPMKLGVAGAAYATVISQYASFVLALVYLRKFPELIEYSADCLKIRRTMLLPILKVSIPSILQSSIASVSWLLVTSQLNAYGTIVSAGNGISVKIKDICQRITQAIAQAATAMVAQNLGARKFDRARSVMYEAMKVSVLVAVVMIIIVEIFARPFSMIFTTDHEIIEQSVLNLRIEIIGQIFYAMFPVFNALAIGAGHTLFAMFSSFMNCIVFRVVLTIVLNRLFGLRGLYLGCMIAPSISVPLGWLYERSNIWRRSLVSDSA